MRVLLIDWHESSIDRTTKIWTTLLSYDVTTGKSEGMKLAQSDDNLMKNKKAHKCVEKFQRVLTIVVNMGVLVGHWL
jgi:predicted Ser/Thr protein kinase